MSRSTVKPGDVFGRLTVISKTDKRTRGGSIIFSCLCSCGNKCDVVSANLKNGHTKSCGCLHDEKSRDRMIGNTYWSLSKPREIKLNEIIEDDNCLLVYVKNRRFRINKEDYSLINKCRWYINKNGYVCDNKGRLLHRVIMKVNSKNEIVDHIDHDTLNNTRENLRVVSKTENAMNCSRLGITFDKSRNKWYVSIQARGKRHYLGRYSTKEEAIKARIEGEIKYYGKYRFDRDNSTSE